MNEPHLEPGNVNLPRWIQIPAGIVIALFTFLCLVASLILLVLPNKNGPVLGFAIGAILLFGCLWVLGKCVRLLTGRKTRGGLMSPTALRVVSFFLLVLPIAGLFTGYYRERGPVAIFQACAYVSGFFGLRALARKREEIREDQNKNKD